MITPFTEQDLQSVVDIYNATKMDELINEAHPFSLIPLTQDTKRYQSIFAHQIYLHKAQNTQGFIAFDTTHINGLFVLPKYRGQGIARKLMQQAIQQMEGVIHLQVVKSNQSAIKLYESLGFVSTDEFIAEYNQQHVDVIKMQLDM